MTAPLVPVLCPACRRPYFRVHTCPAASRGFEVVPDAPEIDLTGAVEEICAEDAPTQGRPLSGAGNAIPAESAADYWRRVAVREHARAEREARRRLAAECDLMACAEEAARATGRAAPSRGEALGAYAVAVVAETAEMAARLKVALREVREERDEWARRAEVAEGRLARLGGMARGMRLGIALDAAGYRRAG